MEKKLLDRLHKLEHRTGDLRDFRGVPTADIMAYLAETLGHMPTDADLERLAAGERSGEEGGEHDPAD